MRVSCWIGAAAVIFGLPAPAIAQTDPAPRAEQSAPAPGLYMIRLRPGPAYRHGTPLLQQDLREHGRYMRDLVQRGVILLADPTIAESGGLIVLHSASIEQARAHMLADPAIRSGLFVGEVSDWAPAFDPGRRFAAPSPPRP